MKIGLVRYQRHTTRFFQRGGVLRDIFTLNILIYSEENKDCLFSSLLFWEGNSRDAEKTGKVSASRLVL